MANLIRINVAMEDWNSYSISCVSFQMFYVFIFEIFVGCITDEEILQKCLNWPVCPTDSTKLRDCDGVCFNTDTVVEEAEWGGDKNCLVNDGTCTYAKDPSRLAPVTCLNSS
jgi:hypothetical protein